MQKFSIEVIGNMVRINENYIIEFNEKDFFATEFNFLNYESILDKYYGVE